MEELEDHTDSLHRQATWNRVRNTWFEQSNVRQKVILKILLGRVTQQIGRNKTVAMKETKVIANPWAESLEDLQIPGTHDSRTPRTPSSIDQWQMPSFALTFASPSPSRRPHRHHHIAKVNGPAMSSRTYLCQMCGEEKAKSHKARHERRCKGPDRSLESVLDEFDRHSVAADQSLNTAVHGIQNTLPNLSDNCRALWDASNTLVPEIVDPNAC